MDYVRWLIRSLLFYKRISLGILLAAAAATAILVGSLLVGDSVQMTLVRQMENRLGRTHLVLLGQETFFRPQLARDLSEEMNTQAAAVLMLYGYIENSDGTRRVNQVNVIGVDDSYADLSPSGKAPWLESLPNHLVVNETLAYRLRLVAGEEVVLSVRKSGGLPAESILFPDSELRFSIRLPVAEIASDEQFGSFGLRADSSGTLNVFADRQALSEWIGRPGLANAVLLGGGADAETVRRTLRQTVQLEDLGLIPRRIENLRFFEVQSRRVFIQQDLSDVLMRADPRAVGVLTYFVNEIAKGSRSVPYSMVAGIGSADVHSENVFTLLADDEIILNEWLANDLKADRGDRITLRYFAADSKTDALRERTESFRVHSVMPMMGLGADPTLMPAFPSLAEADNCRDWEPGIPIDLSRIRPRDEAYWDKYRGSPKAFISLSAAQRLWASRFGNLTAVRYPLSMTEGQLTESVRENLDPSAAGLVVDDIRSRGRKAAGGMTDFGSLFAGLSMFLLGSALVLTAMIFHYGIERQADQIGLLKAVGFTGRRIRWMVLGQGFVLAAGGAAVGIVLALVYTRLLIWGLSGVWSEAVAAAPVEFHIRLSTLAVGAAIALAVSLISMGLGLRRLTGRPAAQLLSGPADCYIPSRSVRWNLPVSVLLFLLGTALVVWSVLADNRRATAVFFLSGILLLAGVIFFGRYFFHSLAVGSSAKQVGSVFFLAFRNLSRRPGRSLAVLTTMACGVFLVTAVGLNRKAVPSEITNRNSGTGGFVLMAESGLPVLRDLNDPAFRRELALEDSSLGSFTVVPLRVRAGEDAGCLNLSRAQQPRLLGVSPEALARRGCFRFERVWPKADRSAEAEADSPWYLLDASLGPDVVPAVGDAATVRWGLGLAVGDTLRQWDENGRPFDLKIVGMINNSVLQGHLLISEENFISRFGSIAGYRMFLIDAESEKAAPLSAALTKGLRPYGAEVISTREKLAAFNAVENTYLSIFLVLGGLGLLLGTVGLGLVVWLNILDRRGELAMMQALGFDKSVLMTMLQAEHTLLLSAGVLAGVMTALVAVVPALSAGASQAGLGLLLGALAAIFVSGWFWIHLASAAALSGTALAALRNE